MEILSFFLVSFITALMCVFILLETRNVQRMYVLCKFNIWVHCLLSTFPPFNGRRNGPSESSSVTLCLLKLTKPSPSLHTDPHHSLASTDGIPLSVPATCSSSRDWSYILLNWEHSRSKELPLNLCLHPSQSSVGLAGFSGNNTPLFFFFSSFPLLSSPLPSPVPPDSHRCCRFVRINICVLEV